MVFLQYHLNMSEEEKFLCFSLLTANYVSGILGILI